MSFKEGLKALYEFAFAKARIKWITKILLSYLILTLLLIGAVPIISNHFIDMLYHNEVNYNDKQLYYISNEIDNYLRNVKSQVYILSNSTSLKKLSMVQSKYDPDFLLYSDKFYTELSSLYNINDIAADISIYFKDIDFFVTKSGSCNFKDYVNMQLQYDKYNSEDIENFISMNDAEFALLPASKSYFANGIVSQNNIEHLIPVTIRIINNDTPYLINKVCLFINLSAEKIFRNTGV